VSDEYELDPGGERVSAGAMAGGARQRRPGRAAKEGKSRRCGQQSRCEQDRGVRRV
jgi:hypothetical protein